MQDLTVTLMQRELAWEQAEDNRTQIEASLREVHDPGDLVVLPEMFTTGFSMNALANAEPPGGDTETWMLGRLENWTAPLLAVSPSAQGTEPITACCLLHPMASNTMTSDICSVWPASTIVTWQEKKR